MGKPAGLSQAQRRALDRLRSILGSERFYLAGGSAIATHLGHRRSLDLDLFSVSPKVDLAAVAEAVRSVEPKLRALSLTDASLRMVLNGVPVDIVRYPYRLLEPPSPGPEAFPTAGLRDLAAMKLAAIARRGLRRDFWDLYAILGVAFSLREAASAYVARFGAKDADLYHVLRALTYFDDAEKDPVYPEGLSPQKWGRIKVFFQKEAPKLLTP